MVLELKIPNGEAFSDLSPIAPKFLSYIFSFIYVGIYWNNHHHLFQATKTVNGKILWANLHLLFWLSMVPLATAWMGETVFARNTVALYGFILLMCAVAFTILERYCIKNEGKESLIGVSLESKFKEYVSIFCYLAGIITSFFYPVISVILYYIVAVIWFIPDTRIEKRLE